MRKIAIVCLAALARALVAQALPAGYLPLSGITARVDFGSVSAVEELLSAKTLEYASDSPEQGGSPVDPRSRAAALLAAPKAAAPGYAVGTAAGSVFLAVSDATPLRWLFSIDAAVRSLDATADGTTIVATGGNGKAWLWRAGPSATLTQLDVSALPGSGSVGRVRISSDGSRLLVTAIFASFEDFWYLDYVVEAATGLASNSIPAYDGYRDFTPDGKALFRLSEDYTRHDGRDARFREARIQDFEGNDLAAFAWAAPDGPGHERAFWEIPRQTSGRPVLEAGFDACWTEFGLVVLTARKDAEASGKAYNASVLAPGPKTGLDLVSYRGDKAERAAWNLGFRASPGADGETVVYSRLSSGGATLWSRKMRTTNGNGTVLVDPDQRLVALAYSKMRPTPDFSDVRRVRQFQVLDWADGQVRQPATTVVDESAGAILQIGPAMEYLLFSRGEGGFSIFWPGTGVTRVVDGTAKWVQGPDADAPARMTGYAKTVGGGLGPLGGTWSLAAAPGQVGSIVDMAIDPGEAFAATVDEAGQFFLRRLSDGAVLFAGRIALLPGYTVGLAEPSQVRALVQALKDGKAPQTGLRSPSRAIRKLILKKAEGFHDSQSR